MTTVFYIFFASLFTASMMWPSEGAIHGDGLHLSVLWLSTAAIVVAFSGSKRVSATRQGWHWSLVVAVSLLVGGIWLSTWHVFRIHGDRRSALNLAFEWTALGAAWWLTGRVARAGGKPLIATLIISLSAGAAVQGICQHHLIYPARAAWYTGERDKLDQAIESGMSGSLNRKTIEGEFQKMDIPTSGPGRVLFEGRLLSSTEPVGPFALANTLGGLLAVSLVLLAGAIVNDARQGNSLSPVRLFVTSAVLLLVGYCLLLTKSRTAWLACAVGIVTLILQHRSSGILTRLRKFIAASLVIAALIVAAGVGSGAIDKEVVLESPRSVQFRLVYWMGSAGVIAENPLFGTGPGNFRQAYLKHKPDESSEQILDPHNIVIDAWVSGGVLGVGGILLLFWSALAGSRSVSDGDVQTHSKLEPFNRRRGLLGGIIGGCILHFGWLWVNGGEFGMTPDGGILQWQDGVWLVPAVATVLGAVALPWITLNAKTAFAGFLALFVHLLAAGGLQISGIILLLLVLHSAGASDFRRPLTNLAWWNSVLVRRIAGLLILSMATCCLAGGLIPVYKSSHLRALATEKAAYGDYSGAEKSLELALREDPIAVESCQQLAALLTYDFMRAGGRYAQSRSVQPQVPESIRESYEKAIAAADRLIDTDRRGWNGFHARSQLVGLLAELTNDSRLAEREVLELERALAFYPGNAELWTELADASIDSGDLQKARVAATEAVRLDTINHEWGHIDRYLDEAVSLRMMEITEIAPN